MAYGSNHTYLPLGAAELLCAEKFKPFLELE
jgi:hypothetical protein